MTTETKTESTTTPASNDNKTVFGPLGKYAMVAVIMVSIIVTTAIMLDKQLKNVDEQVATIENQVAKMHAAATDDTNTSESVIADSEIKQAETAKEEVIETVAVITTPAIPAVEETTAEMAKAATSGKQTAQESATAPVVAAKTKQNTAAATAAALNMAKTKNAALARQEQLAKENQARIEAYKLEQKKHMTEVFARIKSLESQQLDRYKANQDDQVVRLREQISQQQQMIETLVLRNKKLFEMRAANMQRSQDKRQQALNRI